MLCKTRLTSSVPFSSCRDKRETLSQRSPAQTSFFPTAREGRPLCPAHRMRLLLRPDRPLPQAWIAQIPSGWSRSAKHAPFHTKVWPVSGAAARLRIIAMRGKRSAERKTPAASFRPAYTAASYQCASCICPAFVPVAVYIAPRRSSLYRFDNQSQTRHPFLSLGLHKMDTESFRIDP